ncbi:MAG: hypothetical protein ACEB74_09120 [Desulfovibrio aminophilus]|uniref:hypothetical protein n=1 Tax=Desulfovibrio aminophilus TaxID=81425 RepID=UPI0039E8C0F1
MEQPKNSRLPPFGGLRNSQELPAFRLSEEGRSPPEGGGTRARHPFAGRQKGTAGSSGGPNKNLAIDIRAKKYNRNIMLKIQNKLSKELGNDYDVLYEEYPDDPDNNHIHIEYDPKGKVMK